MDDRNSINSEYNSAGELFGAMSNKHSSIRSRAEFEKHAKELPGHIQQGLIKGSLRLADYMLYSIKQVTSKTVKLFEPQDNKETSLRNVANAKLPKNFVFVVSGIYLLAGVSATLEPDKIKSTDFQSIKAFPAIATGEHYLKANKQTIIPEGSANRKFMTDNCHLVNLGYFKLDNPRLIRDEELIEFVLELGTMDGLVANTHVFVGLDGTGTTP